MTVNKDQAQMLAALAVACRPHRAPTWDEPGVLAQIAKVRERDLGLVAVAVLLAAVDPDAKTPGVIPTNGSHWNVAFKPGPYVPNVIPPEVRCSTCGLAESDCKRTWAKHPDPHEFAPDFRPDPTTDITRVVEELRGLVVEGKAEPEPAAEKSTPTPNPHAEAARAALTTKEIA